MATTTAVDETNPDGFRHDGSDYDTIGDAFDAETDVDRYVDVGNNVTDSTPHLYAKKEGPCVGNYRYRYTW